VTTEIHGGLQGQGLKVGVVVARFNKQITSRLLEGAKAALARHGVRDEDVSIVWVPGSFEIPVIAKKMADSRRYDAVICLGAIIKGETDHNHHIATEAAKGIANAGLAAGVPVIFGVLTTDTVEQALDRSGGVNGKHVEAPRASSKPGPDAGSAADGHGNSGYNAGVAAVEMANLVRDLEASV
jgi:6,7-dimethyl-8-ribityllumazine synthase